jgi:hypothetical protein
MKTLPISTDKIAISLSLLCTVHCVATPILIALVPSLAILGLDSETFHLRMVIAVFPISLYALILGYIKHHESSVLFTGILGLAFLISAVLFGESHLGEVGEKVCTVIGSVLIALSHFKNFTLCRKLEKCVCPSDKRS